ncbi:hypothetical protein AYJ57_12410 [Salipiger sp. CCB-MM3]|nr:hypothetical protein AYJ57_12410 [Salipiger sp. CCB-MM3]
MIEDRRIRLAVEERADGRGIDAMADDVGEAHDNHEAQHAQCGEPRGKAKDQQQRQDKLRCGARGNHQMRGEAKLAGVIIHRRHGARKDLRVAVERESEAVDLGQSRGPEETRQRGGKDRAPGKTKQPRRSGEKRALGAQ